MFDFGFSKLIIIGAVALVVIGPKQLPMVARTLGGLWGKASRYIAEAKQQINQAVALDDIQQLKSEMENSFHQAKSTIKNQFEEVEQSINNNIKDINTSLTNTSENSVIDDFGDGYTSIHDVVDQPITSIYNSHPAKRNWRLKKPSVPIWYTKQKRCTTTKFIPNKVSKLRRKISH